MVSLRGSVYKARPARDEYHVEVLSSRYARNCCGPGTLQLWANLLCEPDVCYRPEREGCLPQAAGDRWPCLPHCLYFGTRHKGFVVTSFLAASLGSGFEK